MTVSRYNARPVQTHTCQLSLFNMDYNNMLFNKDSPYFGSTPKTSLLVLEFTGCECTSQFIPISLSVCVCVCMCRCVVCVCMYVSMCACMYVCISSSTTSGGAVERCYGLHESTPCNSFACHLCCTFHSLSSFVCI